LKRPLGKLIAEKPKIAMCQLSALILKSRPPKIIVVGDRVSKNVFKNKITPDVFITDGRVMRRKVETMNLPCEKILHISNPRSTLTVAAWNAVKHALETDGPTRIMVEGEEDLLTLPSILLSPTGSLVVYGQPKEGVVVVRASREKKRQMWRYIKEMRPTPKG
jgi:uncharacterized protein (UPF0218 family)